MNKIKDIVKEIIQIHSDRLERLASSDKPKIGWLSIYTPEEVIYAADCIPYRITGELALQSHQASAFMHRNICSYVLACFDEALLGYHHFLDGIVIVNACDARRRLYDVWKYNIDTDFIHFLDLPKAVTPRSKHYFKEQIDNLIHSLEHHFGHSITSDKIMRAIDQGNETRMLLNTFDRLRAENTAAISGAEALSIIKASMAGSRNQFNAKIKKLNQLMQKTSKIDATHKTRVLICGSYFDHAHILDFIEETDAEVVCTDISYGIQYYRGQIDSKDDPVSAMADFYLEKATCARMIETEKRFNYLHQLVADYRIDSIIYFVLKFCDSNALDYPYLKHKFTKLSLPILLIEDEYTNMDNGQIKTRIQAFLEKI